MILPLFFTISCLLNRVSGLNVVLVTPCQTGHALPSSGVIRELLNRGHSVDLIVTDNCCDTINILFKNVTNCYQKVLFPSRPVLIASQIRAVMTPKHTDIFAHIGVQKMFEFVHDIFQENDYYDVMIHDYMFIGAHLAAKLHNIPVVTYYVGPLPLPLADEPYERKGWLFFPDSKLPSFLYSFYDVFSIMYNNMLISTPSLDYIRAIEDKHKLFPEFNYFGVNFNLPYTYYYIMSIIVHLGPPEVTLPSSSFMNRNTNINHVGFVPDSEYLKPLDSEITKFLESSRKPVVFMSLGTVFQMPSSHLEELLVQFANQEKYCFIWSASNVYYEDLKKRKMTNDRFLLVTKIPQMTMILHEKVKVFITHAGKLI